MKSQRILIGAFALGLLLALAVGLSQAQGPGPDREVQPQGEVSIAGTVSSKISYQGVLKEGGAPVNGTRTITFTLYSDDACSAEVDTIVENAVSVTGGLFSVDLEVNHSDFNGQPLWLETEVGGTRIGCQEILPVPYALSLRPGAVVSGTAYQAFRVNSYAPTGGVPVAVVGVVKGAADGVGVFGKNYINSAGATGMGVWGITDSPAGKGVYGQATSGSGIGVYGNSPTGTGVAARSTSGDPIRAYGGLPASEVFRVDSTGTVTQTRMADGLVKAGAYVACSGSTSFIERSFNNVSGTITLVENAESAECTIDFGFQIDDRYWAVTTHQDVSGAFPNACTASCVPVGDGSMLECTRWNDRLGSFQGGYIMVLVY